MKLGDDAIGKECGAGENGVTIVTVKNVVGTKVGVTVQTTKNVMGKKAGDDTNGNESSSGERDGVETWALTTWRRGH